MGEKMRSLGAMLITAPSEHERQFDMAVRLSSYEIRLLEQPGAPSPPWLRITANLDTHAVECAAGITVKKE